MYSVLPLKRPRLSTSKQTFSNSLYVIDLQCNGKRTKTLRRTTVKARFEDVFGTNYFMESMALSVGVKKSPIKKCFAISRRKDIHFRNIASVMPFMYAILLVHL